jgi:hypothetical protein
MAEIAGLIGYSKFSMCMLDEEDVFFCACLMPIREGAPPDHRQDPARGVMFHQR